MDMDRTQRTEGTGQRPAHQMRWITPLTLLTSVERSGGDQKSGGRDQGDY